MHVQLENSSPDMEGARRWKVHGRCNLSGYLELTQAEFIPSVEGSGGIGGIFLLGVKCFFCH